MNPVSRKTSDRCASGVSAHQVLPSCIGVRRQDELFAEWRAEVQEAQEELREQNFVKERKL